MTNPIPENDFREMIRSLELAEKCVLQREYQAAVYLLDLVAKAARRTADNLRPLTD